MRLKTLTLALSAAALLGAAATSRANVPFLLNFDGPGAVAEAFAPIAVTIGYGVYGPALDGFGDPVPNSDRWTLDLLGGSVPVIDPSTVGYGAAPSPAKALDARDGTVLFVFDQPVNLASFRATLDNSTFGNTFNSPIEFYDLNHNLLSSVAVNQTIPGFTVNTQAIANVKTIVLPGGAFYDNIQAVPEPSTWALLALAAGFVVLRMRRRAS